MKKFISGALVGAILTSGIVLAANYTATENPFPVKMDGKNVSLEGYNIEGSTYFKLRDIADVVGGFNVDFRDNTIVLTSEKSNTTAKPNTQTQETVKTKELQPIEVKDFGWSLSDGGYLDYGIVLHNPNEKTAYNFPSFRITAKDANGVLLGTEDQTLCVIYPGETIKDGGMAFKCSEMPASVQVEVLDSEEYNIQDVSTLKHPEHQPFEIVNATIRDNKLVGEIINHDDYDYRSVAVSVIFRDSQGKIIGGDTTFVENLKAKDTVPFEQIIYSDYATNNYEICAYIWI